MTILGLKEATTAKFARPPSEQWLQTERLKPSMIQWVKTWVWYRQTGLFKVQRRLQGLGRFENQVLKQCELNDENSVVSEIKWVCVLHEFPSSSHSLYASLRGPGIQHSQDLPPPRWLLAETLPFPGVGEFRRQVSEQKTKDLHSSRRGDFTTQWCQAGLNRVPMIPLIDSQTTGFYCLYCEALQEVVWALGGLSRHHWALKEVMELFYKQNNSGCEEGWWSRVQSNTASPVPSPGNTETQ